jgi:hypothetical protein
LDSGGDPASRRVNLAVHRFFGSAWDRVGSLITGASSAIRMIRTGKK